MSGATPYGRPKAPVAVPALTARLLPQPEEPLPLVADTSAKPGIEKPPPVARRPAEIRNADATGTPSEVWHDSTPSQSIGPAPDSTYYSARQLDIYPALAAPLGLRYPAQAAEQVIRGRALVELLIGATGTVDDVTIVEAEPRGYFEHDLRTTFLAARFTPALRDGRVVRSRVLVRVTYGAEDTPQ